MRPVDPGTLRHRLTLEAAQTTPDGAGGHTEIWVTVATVAARIEPLAAKSRFGADQRLETVTHGITIRHRADVLAGMRLRKAGRVFAIRTVHDPDETGRYLVIEAWEEGA